MVWISAIWHKCTAELSWWNYGCPVNVTFLTLWSWIYPHTLFLISRAKPTFHYNVHHIWLSLYSCVCSELPVPRFAAAFCLCIHSEISAFGVLMSYSFEGFYYRTFSHPVYFFPISSWFSFFSYWFFFVWKFYSNAVCIHVCDTFLVRSYENMKYSD